MAQGLHPEALIEAAQRRTGLGEFDSQSFRDGLSILISQANRYDRFTPEGQALFVEQVTHYLANRLKVADWARTHPEIVGERIERPVIVLGAPRTGTTLVANLLATDPARRSLLSWIIDDPIPPPGREALTSDPRCLAALDRERIARERDPSAGRFYRSSAVYPHECIYVMHSDFKSLAWEACFPNPIYSDFMLNGDISTAYDYHRLFLQAQQSAAPGCWNLKMPSHALHIRWVMQAYPDARLVWTHRDPFTALGSLMSLISNSHRRYAGDRPDDAFIAGHYPAQIAAHVDRMVAFEQANPQVPIHHLRYAEMMRDPLAEMRRLYASLGDAFTEEVEAGMRTWLADNPQGKYGKHAYGLERFGHSEASLRPFFENYLAHFELEREGL